MSIGPVIDYSQLPDAYIRTSDRIEFKRCRRRWNWSSGLKNNLTPIQVAEPLWLGTGFHFALEDFHGHRHFDRASDAFGAFVDACRRAPKYNLPDAFSEESELAKGMLDYYQDYWLRGRPALQTYVHDGKAQLEVPIFFEIPSELLPAHRGYNRVYYTGSLDRVIIDPDGQLWIVEYKTAKQFVTAHFQTDAQVTAYCWAASILYPGMTIAGVIYQQHYKKVADYPRVLTSGKISSAKNQTTSHRLYKEALDNLYGSADRAPQENIECLNHLAEEEGEERDKFVYRERVRRSQHQLIMEGQKILAELTDMLNPDTPLYPNPTRDCSWCSFLSPCVSFDDGVDWEAELLDSFQPRDEEDASWRKYLILPNQTQSLQEQQEDKEAMEFLQLP